MRPVRSDGRAVIAISAIVVALAGDASAALPPGRPYVLTIKGGNTINFTAQTGIAPLPIDYKATIEYLVNNRSVEATSKAEATARKKPARRPSRAAARQAKAQPSEEDDSPRATAVVDLALHSAEMALRHRGQMIVQTGISRNRFQGRFLPDAPVLSVTYYQAPPALQEILQRFDATAASILLDDRENVMARRIRFEGRMHAIVETLLSIHTPIPKDVATWEAPTQLAMGHGQTAKGQLKFEKDKASAAEAGGLVKVRVSGVLKAEGAIVGNLIKDGTYKVTGEQSYDPRSREWKSARWSVEIETELANQGTTVAHGRGKMLVESRVLDREPAPRPPARDKRRAGGTASPGAKGAPG